VKLYTVSNVEPPQWTQHMRRSTQFFSPTLTGKLAVYKCIYDAGTSGVSRTDIIAATNLKPHTVSFYLSKFTGQGYVLVNGAARTPRSGGAPNSINMSFPEARDAALLALENCLVIKAKAAGISDDMRRAFVVYQKAKAHVLSPSHDTSANAVAAQEAEASTALKIAIRKLLDILF
jgi:hypothetical protein